MPACLDITKAHIARVHGDIRATYTWINGERALVLHPAFRQKAPWFVLMESAAYQYDDPGHLQRQGLKACQVLGLEPTMANWVRIATILNEGLPDLYRMPSEPSWERKKREYGELKVMADGKQIAAEALTIEDKGAEYVPA